MNNVVQLKQPDDVLGQASQWIAKLDRGLSPEEERELQRWMKHHPEHESTLLHMAKLWDKLDALERLADICPDHCFDENHSPASTKKPSHPPEPSHSSHSSHGSHSSHASHGSQSRFSRKPRDFATAASVLFACLLTFAGAYHYLGNNSNALNVAHSEKVLSETEIRTQIGQSITQTLSDGSVLTLNTNSRVKVIFTNRQRILALQQGELHIEVAHNAEQPLSVYAGDNIIQAVGTAFNVEYYNDHLELLVTDGKVRVAEQNPHQYTTRKRANIAARSASSNAAQSALSQPSPEPTLATRQIRLPASSLSLNKGEKSVLSAPTKTVVKVAQADIDAALSWQQGKLTFRGETLQHALQEVSRYTDVTFEIPDATLAQTHIAGVFKSNDLNALLGALQQNFNIHYQKQGPNKVILTSP